MNPNRGRNLSRPLLLTLVALLVVGCGDNAAANRSRANEEVGVLGEALADMITTTYQASVGRVEPAAAESSIADVRSSVERLSEAATVVDALDRSLIQELLVTTERTLSLVSQQEFEQAEQLRRGDFMDVATELAELPLDTGAGTPTQQSTGPNLFVLLATAVFVATILVIVRRRSRRQPNGRPGQSHRVEGAPPSPSQIERAWSEIPQLFGPDQPDDEVEDGDANRSMNARTIAVDLRELLRSTLHQAKDYGMETSLTCPSVDILVDPVKFRRAVLRAIANAQLGGARRVGFLIEVIDDSVLLTIGRDVPPAESDAEEFAAGFVDQVATALDVDELEWSLINDDDLLLTTIVLDSTVRAGEMSGPIA